MKRHHALLLATAVTCHHALLPETAGVMASQGMMALQRHSPGVLHPRIHIHKRMPRPYFTSRSGLLPADSDSS